MGLITLFGGNRVSIGSRCDSGLLFLRKARCRVGRYAAVLIMCGVMPKGGFMKGVCLFNKQDMNVKGSEI